MGAAPHRVRRQVWRIRAPGADDAFALRQGVRAAWDDVLLPALEAAFDQAAPGEGVVRIPRLELRLRLETAADVRTELPRLLREAAGVELALATRGGIPDVWTAAGGAAVSPAAEGRSTLLHYLRTGGLPWSAAGGPVHDVAADLRASARDGGPRLLETMADAPRPRAFAFRLLQLLDEADAPAWMAALPGRVPALWRRVLLRLLGSVAEGEGGAADAEWTPPPRHARLELASALLADALAGTQPLDETPAALAAAVDRAADAGTAQSLRSTLAALPQAIAGSTPGTRGGRARTTARPGSPSPASVDAGPAERRRGADRGASRDGWRPASPGEAAAAELALLAATRPDLSAPDEEPGLSVANGGLVLLHSFLPALLEHTGVREGDAIPMDRLPRAAALLHYLATGREDVLEWELAFVKVLLGLTPDDPLPVAEGCLRPEDRQEAENLLASAIAHWSVLRGASPDVVRGTFLQRGGLLRRDAVGWTLRMEPAPFDVLLAHLPWSISVARLPWMKHPIYTEWTTTP
ncbi:MAG TPA: contractile injection system tape measure protein [Longimicrobium sp.]